MQKESNSNENQRRLAEERGRNINYGSLTRKILDPPPLDEVKQILESTLRESFDEASVSVVHCPDLREPPFYLTASGLCGNSIAMEFGGHTIPFLYCDQMYNRKTTWNLPSTLNSICPRSLFAIGAYENCSSGNFCEVTANFSCSPNHDTVRNNNYCTTTIQDNHISKFDTSSEFLRCDKHGTLFISDGNQGDVLKVHAKGGRHNRNFVRAMYSALKRKYESRLIALGGTFVVNKGVIKHEFPNFYYYDYTSTPLIAVGTIFNTDTFTHPNLNTSKITCEHFHTFTHNATFRGGHFVNDQSPRTIEYEGYFNLASEFICVDPIIIPGAYN